MTPIDFDLTLRSLVQREPFEPFVVELTDGTSITVPHPAIAFGGGVAGFIGEDGGLRDFTAEQVRQIRTAVAEPTQ